MAIDKLKKWQRLTTVFYWRRFWKKCELLMLCSGCVNNELNYGGGNDTENL